MWPAATGGGEKERDTRAGKVWGLMGMLRILTDSAQ